VVPKTALQTIEGQTVVFVKTEEGFEPKPVTLGKTSETHVEIISGIKPGQQYIAQGGFTLKAQLAKGGFSAGHSH
ncbi:MAG: secretion protein HlyD, partial [Nitrospinales bacterium]